MDGLGKLIHILAETAEQRGTLHVSKDTLCISCKGDTSLAVFFQSADQSGVLTRCCTSAWICRDKGLNRRTLKQRQEAAGTLTANCSGVLGYMGILSLSLNWRNGGVLNHDVAQALLIHECILYSVCELLGIFQCP